MASVYQTWEWRQGGAPPRGGRNTHSTQTWVEALGEGAKETLAALRVEPGRGRGQWGGEAAALEDLEGICSLWVLNQRRNILGRKDTFGTKKPTPGNLEGQSHGVNTD